VICLVALLTVFGVIMVFSTTMTVGEGLTQNRFIMRQMLWACLAFGSMILFANIDYHVYEKLALPGLIVAFMLLGAVLLPQVGTRVNGARRWMRFGSIGFQPSELAKLALIIFTAYFVSRKGEGIRKFFKGYLPPIVLTGLAFLLILKEPDFGTGVIIGAIIFTMLLVGRAHWLHLSASAVLSVPLFYYLVVSTPYRRARFFAFLDPWKYPDTLGYHIIQSLIAIGSGGPLGLGLGASRQKLFFLPEAKTDFIFSIICEEMGFLGAVIIIGLYVLLLKQGIKVAQHAKDTFGFFLAFGMTMMVIIQAAVNIAVVTDTVPTKGCTLPFISFGGSSLLVMMIGMGILLNVCRCREKELGLKTQEPGLEV
jgi:cell division protein FtsW